MDLLPHLGSVLISGSSGIGKSTLATALTERMAEKGFEFCVFDPEGDYDQLENAVAIGDAKSAPQIDEALKHHLAPDRSARSRSHCPGGRR